MRRITVTASTLGQVGESPVTLSKPYRWRGIENWTGGNIPEVLEATPPPFTAGGAAIREIRTARIARFGDILRDLGYPDPRRDIPPAAVIEAGKRVGVGAKTARKYRAALKRQRENCDG